MEDSHSQQNKSPAKNKDFLYKIAKIKQNCILSNHRHHLEERNHNAEDFDLEQPHKNPLEIDFEFEPSQADENDFYFVQDDDR